MSDTKEQGRPDQGWVKVEERLPELEPESIYSRVVPGIVNGKIRAIRLERDIWHEMGNGHCCDLKPGEVTLWYDALPAPPETGVARRRA